MFAMNIFIYWSFIETKMVSEWLNFTFFWFDEFLLLKAVDAFIHEFLEFDPVISIVQIVFDFQSLLNIVWLDYPWELFDEIFHTSAIFKLRLLVLIQKSIHIERLFLLLLFINRVSLRFWSPHYNCIPLSSWAVTEDQLLNTSLMILR